LSPLDESKEVAAMRKLLSFLVQLFAIIACCTTASAVEDTARITIEVDKPGIQISPLLYGIFFEEVSRAGDGGLYAELVRNGNFRAGLLPDGFRIEGKDLITRAGARRRPGEVGNPLDGWSAWGTGILASFQRRMSVAKNAWPDASKHRALAMGSSTPAITACRSRPARPIGCCSSVGMSAAVPTTTS
jgi:hypothetical protein